MASKFQETFNKMYNPAETINKEWSEVESQTIATKMGENSEKLQV